MRTYLEYINGYVTLRNAGEAEFTAVLARLVHDGVTYKLERPDVIHFSCRGNTTWRWNQELSSALEKYASAWDIEAKEEYCDPVRLFKSDQREKMVYGTQLIYYPGFEDDFIQQLPDEIVKAFKAKVEICKEKEKK